MGIAPIGPYAMLPLRRSRGGEFELVPMGPVERSARTEDETYSPSAGDGGSQSQSRDSGKEAQDYELEGALYSSESEIVEGLVIPTGLLAGGSQSSDPRPDPSLQISFFV